MSQIKVSIIADSIGPNRVRITTMQLKYHRYIHGEFMTHRVFSRNASSSRAVPVKTTLKQVWSDPAMPVQWGANKAGMQSEATLSPFRAELAAGLWKAAAKVACVMAWSLMKIGLHKQWANRVLEPWQFIHVLVTATEWDNFFELRCHADAQPEMRALAEKMMTAYLWSIPKQLEAGEWHLPYVSEYINENSVQMSVARCCRVSYLKHDGNQPSMADDLLLFDRLVGAQPIHASPCEHQAQALPVISGQDSWSGNLRGWVQYRKVIEAKKSK